MKISYNENSTFLVRYIDHRNPRLNGFSAIGIYGLNIDELKENQTIKHIDLYLCAADYKIRGELINARTIEHEKKPILQITIPPKQAMLINWINIQDIYLRPTVSGENKISCSGLYVLRTRKNRVLDCSTCLLQVLDSNDNLLEYKFGIPSAAISSFKDGNAHMHNFR